ncbi:DUF262 domain-containing protein [Rothia sp. ZJ932]|uniref:HNH endonuclease family protein n=1 Tax=Rothia sp. ZJ932 TaxID=2810516 RepID=UPI001967BBB6|nr:DUF262 domain-containing protein [Rothia sp. ZJ932]QRZ61817.1 DUF262 domain-containing protein [Rothia sp. ZJ932]
MDITHEELTIRDIVKGYNDSQELGVNAMDGKLDIRPKYQREFVYDPKQREAVIQTIRQDFPLNIMYWAVNVDDTGKETYEVLDGQQRTISFCQYISGDFSIDVDGYRKAFHNLTKDQKEQILNYKLMVYKCTGTESEKLKWFKTINIAGEKLTDQELRNAVYTGTWLTDAKAKFSRPKQAAHLLATNYVTADPKRQQLLETALAWKSNGAIEQYMSDHQHDLNAQELWSYFREVIEWAQRTFPKKRKELKNVHWGVLYDQFKDEQLNPDELETRVKELMIDDDVTKKPGIYPFVLTGDEKFLNIRAFSPQQKTEAYERQNSCCAYAGISCAEESNHVFEIEEMEADHITPWSEGGKTSSDNCQMLCITCNRTKGNR